jgi:ribosomal protein L40E
MKCPKCQAENPKNAKFCVECGFRTELVCPSCGSVNSTAFKFCAECGHDLRKLAETVPVDYSQPQSYAPKFLAEKVLTTRSSIEANGSS